MNTQSYWNQGKEACKRIMTPGLLKKGAVVLLICAVAGGSGTWYHHQQKAEKKIQVATAQTELIEQRAAQYDVAILNESQVKDIAVQTIGKEPGVIQFKKVVLKDTALHQETDKKGYKKEHKQKQRPTQEPAATSPQAAPAVTEAAQPDTQTNAAAMTFHPVYDVEAKVDRVSYKMCIDAVTGQVLKAKVK